MKKLLRLKNPWFWFFLLVILYSIYDYNDHISRPNADFGDHPWSWFGFTFSLLLSDLLLMHFVNLLFHRLLKKDKELLLVQLVAVSLGVFAHLYVFGPALGELFWSGDRGSLTFKAPWQPVALACSIFLAVRVLHFILTKVLKRA